VSPQPRADARREALEESALDLYEHAPCGYLSTDPDGTIVRVNATFLEWTGHRREALVGVKRFAELLTVGGRIYHETHYAPLLRMQDAVREIAVDIVRADGSRLPALVNSTLHRGADGEPLLVRTTVFDATDRKRYERELLAARDRERVARERTERLQALTGAAAAATAVEDIAHAVTEQLVAAFGADGAGLALVEEDGGVRVVHRRGRSEWTPWLDGAHEAVFDEGGPPGGGARAVLALGGREPRGVVWAQFAAARSFAPEERALAIAFAAQTTLALERLRHAEAQRDVAHVLQQSLLAGALPVDDRFEIAALYNPAGEQLEVGGDWYDTFSLPGGTVAIVVGDVVGRGLIAASAMGQLRSATRALAGAGLGPASVLAHLDTFVAQIRAAEYATLAYAEIDPDSGRTRFASAGHPPPVLLDAPDAPRLFMGGRSMPLGVVVPGLVRGQAELTLGPRAGMLLYTDGLVERRGETIDDGLERLLGAAAASRAAGPSALVDELAAALLAGRSVDDDVCLLCFTRR
jgi:PAS domain S-box-containing protein